MKKVVILQEYVPTYREPLFRRLIQLGREQGISIKVAAGVPAGSQYKRGDVASADFVERLKQKELRVAGKRLVLRGIKRQVATADLVILEQARRNIDAYRLLFSMRKKPLVALWGHGKDYVKAPSVFDYHLQRLLTKRCHWFFAYTDGGAAAVKDIGIPNSSITVLRNSIDTTAMSDDASDITSDELAEFRDEYDLTDNVAIFVGGLDSSKRLPFLIEAARLAHERDATFRLLIVGDGAERELVKRSAASGNGVVYAGPLFGRKKTLALLAAKVIAMPGRVGLIAVDSFAVGRPIVSTCWPWHAPEFEYLSPDFDSVITEDVITSYSFGLLEIMQDPSRLEWMQENCQRKSRDYNIEGMAQRFLNGIVEALPRGT